MSQPDPRPAESLRSTPPPARNSIARRRGFAPLLRGFALGAGSGALFGLATALLEARWMHAGEETGPSMWALYLADAGLVPLVTAVLGALIGVMLALLYPSGPPSLLGAAEKLQRAGAGRPADMAAFAPLAALGTFMWATSSAHLARVLLSVEMTPVACGAAIAVSALTLGALTGLVVLALTPVLRTQLARLSNAWRWCVHPGATLAAALLLVALLVTVGAYTGDVSGEGGFLGIYGILRRQELDLRAPTLLLALATVVYLALGALSLVRSYQALIVALLPLALTVRTAAELNQVPALSLRIERAAPLGKRPLALLRALSDGDGDGASSYFGGGDCDDRDPAIGPTADDVPDNGIDEDCSGSDLVLGGAELKPVTKTPAPDAASTQRFADHNLIFITIDTLRHDLGFAGYARNVSPNLDKLAARSTVFERAYSLASYTGKSVGPMLIGKYGSETHRNWGHFNKFGEEDTFVAQRLQKAGLFTISVQGHRYFGQFGGLERGFDKLDLSAAPAEGAKWATDTRVTSDKLTDAAMRELDSRPQDKRFFLWVHYLDPHADYKAHEGIPSMGGGARGMYDAEVAFTDKHIGRLLDHVSASAYASKTSIIVTSDHGEAFGEHNMWRHGFEVWEPLVRVPLIVHVPGAKPARISQRRSLIDIAPTILELTAVAAPSDADPNDFLSGESLAPEVLSSGNPAGARDILVDMPAGPYNESRRAFIHQDLKLTLLRDGAKKQLFDLAADPQEKEDIWSSRKGDIEAPYALFKKRLRVIEVTGKSR